MSIKTLRKRIALVAVSALGAGLMSVVAVPSANAAASADTAYIGYTASTTGLPAHNSGDPTTAQVSVGLVSVSNNNVSTGTVATGTILPTAQISFIASSASAYSAVVTGGYIGGSVATVGSPTVASNALSVFKAAAGSQIAFTAIPNVAVGGTMTVSFYAGSGVSASAPTAGTLIGSWVLTVASASVSGVPSASESTINIQTANAKGTAADGSNAYDDNSNVGNGKVGLIYVDLEDAYGVQVSGGTLTATVTGDAYVNIGTDSSDQYAALYAFDSVTLTAHPTYVNVVQKTAHAPATAVVTISYMGSTLAQKTIKFTGDADSITYDAANSFDIFKVGATGLAPTGALEGVYYIVKDSAGNAIDWTTDPTLADTTGSMVQATIDTTYATSSTSMSASSGYGTVTMTVPSTATVRGAGTYKLAITNARGTTLKTAAINATISGSAYSFEASWDKAAYNSGEIAVLTITAKDSKGNLVADGDAGGTNAAITVNTDGLGSLTTSCDTLSTKVFVAGKMTCKFAVKNTAGSYSYSVYVPTSSLQAATVGTVKINAAAAVSNAEVLAAIVKLIASINKQIKALQKSLKR